MKVFTYLGLIIDDRVNWRPAVQQALATSRRLLKNMHRLCGTSWGNGQMSMLRLYKGLVMSRMMYALPLINIAGPQWDSLERLHRVASRFCLGIPSFANNVTTITKAQEKPLRHHAGSRALCHLARMNQTSTTRIFKKLLVRKRSHLGKLA